MMFNKSSLLKESIFTKLLRPKKSDTENLSAVPEKDEATQIFINEISIIIDEFKKTKETSLQLKPMNSYFRHLAHQLAQDKGLFSASEGSNEERHLVIFKQAKSAEIARSKKDRVKSEVKGEADGNKTAERPSNRNFERKPDNKNTRNNNSSRPRNDSSRNSSSRSKGSDTKEYLVPVSTSGLEVILDKNGYVGLRTNQTDEEIVDTKKITSGAFTVVNNKIQEIV